MDLKDSPEEAEFRAGVTRWLAENLPEGWGSPGFTHPKGEDRLRFLKEWTARLHEAGYSGVTWPKEYGGQGAPIAHQAILFEEMSRAEAPPHIGIIGIGMAGPTIIAHGTDEQKGAYLEPMLSGEEVWCQGFSEPGAGSDLASLKTRAVEDGEHYLISGQKVWSSFAQFADRCILLARTDPDAPKHEGITYFLLDMQAEGVEVRPLRQITGDPEFNEIFLDEVRVPRENVLGEVNSGWTVAITTLMHERIGIGFVLMGALEARFRRLLDLARDTHRNGSRGVPTDRSERSERDPWGASRAADDPVIRDKLAALWEEIQALRYTAYRALSTFVKRGAPGPEGSIVKIHWAETNQRLGKLALDILGPEAQLDGPSSGEPGPGYWQYQQLRSRGGTIEGGTSEILRNIVAERVLGLPKSR